MKIMLKDNHRLQFELRERQQQKQQLQQEHQEKQSTTIASLTRGASRASL